MSTKNFRIGLVFTPTSLVSAGVLNTNQKDAYEFMELIQPLIEDFMDRVRESVGLQAGQSGPIRLPG